MFFKGLLKYHPQLYIDKYGSLGEMSNLFVTIAVGASSTQV